jgi:type IV pilus assembly protein PilQ
MIIPRTNSCEKTILFSLLTIIMALFLGCVSNKSADVKPSATKRITDIVINENSKSIIFTVKGNQELTYTEIKQAFPKGILFHFPDTTLDIVKQTYIPPVNKIISSIEVNEIVEDKTTTSSIFVALKKDVPYDLNSDETGLKVSFPNIADFSTKPKPQKEFAETKPEPKIIQKSVPAATRLKTVTVTPSEDNIVVNVIADGAIRDYKSFSIDNPPRIVFDIPKIKSPYKTEKKISAESNWVKRIRYFGHPGKVRLVLDTQKAYLSTYSALPTDTGLVIQVGRVLAASKNASHALFEENLRTRQVTISWDKVMNATSYNVYWRDSAGVTKNNGRKISTKSPLVTIKGLKPETTYYFVVTTVKEDEESEISAEISYTIAE